MTNAATLALLPTVVTPTTTGRLGIKTTTPGSVLDVNGNAAFRSTVSAAGTVLADTFTSNSAISVGIAPIGTYELSVNAGSLGTAANNTTTLATLVSSTTNADYLEFVNIRNASGGTDWTTAGNRLQQRVDATWMGWIGFNNGNTTVTNNGGISFGTGTSNLGPNGVGEKMRLDSTGRLGIGITSPSSLLHVNGTIIGAGTDTSPKFSAVPTSIASASYNYIINGSNDTGTKLVCFVNGSTRSADGGVNAVMIRNDGGPLNLGSTSYATNVYGTTILIDASSGISLNGTTTIAGGTGTISLQDSGDIYAYRSGGTTGVIYLSNSGTRYLYWDASNYNLPGGGLIVGGSISATGEVTAYSSDERLKKNITLIADPLGKIRALRGVMFDWDTARVEHLEFNPNYEHDIGVIAQEVEKVLPEAVRPAPFDTNSDGTSKSGENYLTVQYEKLTALLIEAVKDQQAMIDGLRDRICVLESKLADK